MDDRRKNRRIELKAEILIKNLDGSSQLAAVEITDVSKTGVGFDCYSQLDIGTVYEAHLTIWTKEQLHVFLEIIRVKQVDDKKYNYGSIFVGMSEMDSKRIETYDTISTMEKEKINNPADAMENNNQL